MATGREDRATSPIISSESPRLGVQVTVDGDLEPDSSITIRVEGEANGKIVGGEVVVLLPTFAAMDYAGSDKQPYYPAGKKIPAAARWTLPAMEEGDHWKEVLDLDGVEKGYYHIAVDVRANGPEGSKGSGNLIDEVHQQRWMYIIGGGGVLTNGFDESLFPDEIAPQPGPFRLRGGGSPGQSAASRDVGADGEEDPVYVFVSYLEDEERMPAVDSYAYANTILEEGEDEDWPPKTEGHTVGESGVVAFTCPASGEYWAGHVTLPSNEDVGGSGFVGHWQAGSADCGDTIEAPGPRLDYLPWTFLKEAVPLLEEHFGRDRDVMRWQTDRDRVAKEQGSRYLPVWLGDKIEFGITYDKPWTSAHEFFHALHETELGGLWTADSCGEHDVWYVSSYTCAFLEGVADYAGYYYDPEDSRTLDLPDGYDHPDEDPPYERAEIEGFVGSLILDLIDEYDETEKTDSTSYDASYIADVFASCTVQLDEVGGPDERDDVTDFIWCLEGSVNRELHEKHFPTGPAPPLNAAESATEPDDWNADHIRATWLLNVKRRAG
ncbi:MAG: hypothetical protein OXH08_05900 [Gammaproteobacteria bacterium]|nr:hypothetical protein [Gammaproteobacteria bacterium]